MKRLILSALFCLIASITVRADPFVILPNGELAFNTSFTSTGAFTCQVCSGSGTNSVTFGSGANTLTLTYLGLNNSLVVGGQSVPATVGQIQVVVTGSGFVFPTNSNPNVPLLFFTLTLMQTSPAAGSSSILFNSDSGGGTSLLFHSTFRDYVAISIGPNPPGFDFSHIVYSFPGFTIPNTNAAVEVDANLVAVPEPASMLLLGSGVGMMLGVMRKRFSKP